MGHCHIINKNAMRSENRLICIMSKEISFSRHHKHYDRNGAEISRILKSKMLCVCEILSLVQVTYTYMFYI